MVPVDKKLNRTRLLLSDSSQAYRRGLASLLADFTDIEIAAEVGSADEVSAALKNLDPPPDVVVIDFLPDNLKLETEVTNEFGFLMLASDPSTSDVVMVIQSGGLGILDRNLEPLEMRQAIKAAHRGEYFIGSRQAHGVLERAMQVGTATCPRCGHRFAPGWTLTKREWEVVFEVAKGRTNPQIASILGIREKTVRNHVHSVYHKLGITNRVQITNWVRNKRLLDYGVPGDQTPTVAAD